jgi:FSR family fosmidomycin resistance protein-like MFS transporter
MFASSRFNVGATLLVYGTLHGLVDYVSVGVVFSASALYAASPSRVVLLFLVYNVLAFGLQALIGSGSDQSGSPRRVADIGSLLVLLAGVLLTPSPLAAILLVGLGNAFFHVGGGSISLELMPRRATAPGLFVAPGALGVFAGTLVGRSGHFSPIVPIVLICALALASHLLTLPAIRRSSAATGMQRYFWLVLPALFVAIAVRSLVGLAVVLPWKSNVALAAMLVGSVFLGKSLGGFLADRLGWTKVAAGSLLVAIPLLVFAPDVPALAIAGMLLFNFPMAVTTAAISNLLPGRPGFSFGLTCMALLIGALPTLAGYKAVSAPLVVGVAGLIALAAIWFALYACPEVSFGSRPAAERRALTAAPNS